VGKRSAESGDQNGKPAVANLLGKYPARHRILLERGDKDSSDRIAISRRGNCVA
jgi:hypothetical protein